MIIVYPSHDLYSCFFNKNVSFKTKTIKTTTMAEYYLIYLIFNICLHPVLIQLMQSEIPVYCEMHLTR
jgi:hypothetical protein